MTLQMVNGAIVDIDDDEPPITLETVEFSAPNVETATVSDSDLSCEVCGIPLTYGGRGRKPKFCSEHRKSGGNITPDRNAGAVKARGFQGEAQLRTSLEARYQMLVPLAVMFGRAQYAGVIRESISDCVDADIEYARANLRWRKILEGGVEKSALAAVIVAHGKILAPIMVGERVRAARAPKAAPKASEGESGATVSSFRRRPSGGPFRAGNDPQATAPKPTDLYYPAETKSESPDSVNAGLIPGMPG